MARYTVIENDEKFAKVIQEEDTFSAYILDGPPEETSNFHKAARGFQTEVEAAQWAHDRITTI